MESLFSSFLNAGISGSVMIAAVVLLRLLLKRAPRKMVCLLWIPVLVRLLLPFSIPAPFSLQPDLRYHPEPSGTVVHQEEFPSEDVATPPIALDPGAFPMPQVGPDGVQATPEPPDISTPIPALAPIAASVWLVGIGGMVLYAAISYLRLRWRVRGAIPAEGYQAVYGLDTAFVLGIIRPKIYLPVQLEGQYRSLVLAHERAHIARGDHMMKLAGFAALTLHWYNPTVWLAFSLMCRDIELACDQHVIAGKDSTFRQAYSAALLKLGTQVSPYAHPIAFAEVSAKTRIKAVLNYRKSAFWIILVSAAAIIGIVVFLMTDPAVPEETTPDNSSAQDPGTFPMPQVNPDTPPDPAGWGLSFWANNVSSTGCTLHFRQQGGLTWQDNSGAVIEGELTMGAMFHIQVFDGTQWQGLTPIAKVQWDAILYMLPLDNSLTLDISWEYLYGVLSPGSYRIVKEITGPGETRPDVTCQYYAEFTITDAHVDDAALLETCRKALEEYQSRGGWHMEVTHGYPGTDMPSYVDTWWISGEEFLVSSDSANENITSCTMYRDGAFYQKLGSAVLGEGVDVDVWYQTDMPYGILRPMILLLEWKDENITLLNHQAAMGTQEISLRWKGPFSFLADSSEYMEVTLRLDREGRLEGAVFRANVQDENGSDLPYFSTMVDLSQGYSTEFAQNYIDSQLIDEPIAGDPGQFPTPELEPNT